MAGFGTGGRVSLGQASACFLIRYIWGLLRVKGAHCLNVHSGLFCSQIQYLSAISIIFFLQNVKIGVELLQKLN